MLHKNRLERYKRLQARVRRTPIHRIQNILIENANQIFAKEEWRNPTGSSFDRLYPHLFCNAEKEGKIIPGITPVIETTTGNAGASFAWAARELGYSDCTVIIHQDAPEVRIRQIESYGARVVFSPPGQYSKGCVRTLEEILSRDKKIKGGQIGRNYERLYCVTKIDPRAREPYKQLVKEVVEQIQSIDYFIGIVGSGTSISPDSEIGCEVMGGRDSECSDRSEHSKRYTRHGFALPPQRRRTPGAVSTPT